MKKLFFFFILLSILLHSCSDKKKKRFSYELIPVELDGKWGYVDKHGNVRISPKFNIAYLFADGCALVQDESGKMGYINTKGEYIIPPVYKYASSFSDGLAFVTPENHVPTCIDTTGNVCFQLHDAEIVYSFSDGLALFQTGGKFGFVNKTGKIVIEPQFEDARSFSGGLAAIAADVGKNFSIMRWGYIDKTGKKRIAPQFDRANDFEQNKAFVKENHNNKWGVIDPRGDFVIPSQFDDATYFKDGMAAVRIGDSWGFINDEGKIIVNPMYRNVLPYDNGIAAINNEPLKWNFINRNGHLAFEQTYQAVSGFFNHHALIAQNDTIGFIDRSGNLCFAPKFTNAFPFYIPAEKIFLNSELFNVVISDYFDAKLVADLLFAELYNASFNGLNDRTIYKDIIQIPEYEHLKDKSRYSAYTDDPIDIIPDIAYISHTAFEFQMPIYKMEPEFYYGRQIGEDKIYLPDAQLESMALIIRLGESNKVQGKKQILYEALIASLSQRLHPILWEEFPLEKKNIITTDHLRLTVSDRDDHITLSMEFLNYNY